MVGGRSMAFRMGWFIRQKFFIMKVVFIFCFVIFQTTAWCQVYPLKGQLASTAFPICGEDTIHQTSVPNGFNAGILMPGCDPYTEINPFYYRFTCFTSGSLEFTITPNDPSDNYDWILFDITGRLPSDIFVEPALTIVGNRSGTLGPTGVK